MGFPSRKPQRVPCAECGHWLIRLSPKGIWNHEEGGGHLWRLCLTCGWEGSASYPMCPECSEITDIAVLHAASPDYQAVAV